MNGGRARRRLPLVAWAVPVVLGMAACGESDSDGPAIKASRAGSPAITAATTQPVTVPPVPVTTTPPATSPPPTSSVVATTVPIPTTTVPATTVLTTTTVAVPVIDTSYGAYAVQADLTLVPAATPQHQVLWDLFRRVLGDAATLQYIDQFTVYYDPNRNTDATLLDGLTPGKRHIMINARYADDLRRLTRTFIHEYGHIITLSGDQVTPGGAGCGTTSVDEGCLVKGSYLNGFLDRFWWVHGQAAFDALSSRAANDAFYAAHQTEFVTRYAATDPLEDIAEVWAEFVIRDTPAGTTVAEQKILYLAGFPTLVELRQQIRDRVGDTLGL